MFALAVAHVRLAAHVAPAVCAIVLAWFVEGSSAPPLGRIHRKAGRREL
jgi:hypothetical protein